MMAQEPQKFQTFGEAAAHFYDKVAESAPQRFGKYLSAAGGDPIEAMARYRYNLELSASLLPALHAAELTLRNAIHQAMVLHYLTPKKGDAKHTQNFPDGRVAEDNWWFSLEPNGKPLLNERDWQKVVEAYGKVPKDGLPITPRVIAELTFGFWVELLNPNYDQTIVIPLLRTTMRKVQAKNKANRNQGWLRNWFGRFRDLRNRVSHHEPIFHLNDELVERWQMVWTIAGETNAFFSHLVAESDEFTETYKAGWTKQRAKVQQAVQTFYESRKA